MSVPALYELVGQFRRLSLLAEHEELPPDVVRDCLEALEGNLQIKSENIMKFVLGLEAEADSIDAAAEKMKLRAASRRRRADAIRNYVLFSLQSAGVSKVECLEFTISVRKNPESVEISDPKTVPAEFMVTPPPQLPYPDKKKIGDALKTHRKAVEELQEGEVAPPSPVPGAWLKQGERLEIRT